MAYERILFYYENISFVNRIFKCIPISKVGGGAESVTTTTRTLVNYFLGDSSNECISVTDTPGLGDTECRDEDHMKGIIEAIMEKQHIDLFVWIFRGTDNRFDSRIATKRICNFTNL